MFVVIYLICDWCVLFVKSMHFKVPFWAWQLPCVFPSQGPAFDLAPAAQGLAGEAQGQQTVQVRYDDTCFRKNMNA